MRFRSWTCASRPVVWRPSGQCTTTPRAWLSPSRSQFCFEITSKSRVSNDARCALASASAAWYCASVDARSLAERCSASDAADPGGVDPRNTASINSHVALLIGRSSSSARSIGSARRSATRAAPSHAIARLGGALGRRSAGGRSAAEPLRARGNPRRRRPRPDLDAGPEAQRRVGPRHLDRVGQVARLDEEDGGHRQRVGRRLATRGLETLALGGEDPRVESVPGGVLRLRPGADLAEAPIELLGAELAGTLTEDEDEVVHGLVLARCG